MNLTELESLAKAATPGPWKVSTACFSSMENVAMYSVIGPRWVGDYENWGFTKESADYIAAANPATILKMIEVIRLQHESIKEYARRMPLYESGLKALAAFKEI